jgi:hypothetical protein
MDAEEIFKIIKSSFCELTDFKVRGNSIEITTPYCTINDKFVSVFIKPQGSQFIVSDGGWIDLNLYDTPLFEESQDIIDRVTFQFQDRFSVKGINDRTNVRFYYKICEDISLLSSCVFDLSNFVLGTVNASCLSFKDEKEEKERETFRKDANDFLKIKYNDLVKFRRGLDDFQNIKFNAVVNKGSNLFLVTYITGSSQYYFENDIRRSIVNFEIAQRSKYNELIKERISIINNKSNGYDPIKSETIINLLRERSTREPINWTEKENILEFV